MLKLCSGSWGHSHGASILVQQSIRTGQVLRWRLGGGRLMRTVPGVSIWKRKQDWAERGVELWGRPNEGLSYCSGDWGWDGPSVGPIGSRVEPLYPLSDQPLDARLPWKKAWPWQDSFLQLKTVPKEDWQPRATLQQHSHQKGEQFLHSQQAIWGAHHADYHEGLGENEKRCASGIEATRVPARYLNEKKQVWKVNSGSLHDIAI